MTDWPLVAENDDGIRPAGNPDQCFYCRSKVGQPHARGCVCVTKRVKVRYSFEIEIDVPHFWDKSLVEFNRNEGTWCANNAIQDIEEFAETQDCLCSFFEAEMLETVDETPRRKLRGTDATEAGGTHG